MHPLKKYLKENKIAIGSFCKTIGVSRQSLCNIFNYKFYPRRELAKKIEISTQYNVTAMELLYPEEHFESSNSMFLPAKNTNQ
jgi:DNA-binding XRE family transcriptional regulator